MASSSWDSWFWLLSRRTFLVVLWFCTLSASEDGTIDTETNCDTLTLEITQLKTDYYTLMGENSQLKTDNNNLTLKIIQLESEVNQLKSQTAEESCSSGWKKFGCSCYYRSTEKKTWQQHREECLNQGADLVIINSLEEQEFIHGLRTGGVYASWIGLNRTDRGGRWTWLAGTPLTTQYWYNGYPRDEDENCATYNHRTDPGTWSNRDCSETWPAICEK